MDKQNLQESLTNLLEETLVSGLVDSVDSNKNEISKILTMKGKDLSSLSDQELSSRIFDLSQYGEYLQVFCNMLRIKHIQIKRRFEIKLAKACAKIDKKTTVKEKEMLAILDSKELQDLDELVSQKEAEMILFDKIPDATTELVNAMKKELALRGK